MTPTVTARVQLVHKAGLHARPSVKLTKTAKLYRARIEFAVSEAGPWIDAKSILKVMAAKAPRNAVLHFRAHGEDADHAVSAMVRLIETDFEDDAE